MSTAGIARQLGATRQGHNWRIPLCLRGCGYPLFLADGEDGKLLTHCLGGCSHNAIMAALVPYGLLNGDDGGLEASPPAPVRPGPDPAKIARARELYESASEDERVAVYLRSRGISLTSPVLRFLEQAPHRLGIRLPAMLAPIVNVAGEQTGVHLTFLTRDGLSKADLPKEFQRETRGSIRGGAIRLAAYAPGGELLTGEGVETVASAMEIFGLPGWASVYAGGLKTLELPHDVRRILIAADRDAAGRQCALAARDRWVMEGREVVVKVPPVDGQDFNDVLRGMRRDA
jgi:hypothetical protein